MAQRLHAATSGEGDLTVDQTCVWCRHTNYLSVPHDIAHSESVPSPFLVYVNDCSNRLIQTQNEHCRE